MFGLPSVDDALPFLPTNAFVCFNSDRSLQSADISGKSMCLLFSRSMLMSMACWCACKCDGSCSSRFDSGQMTCESFRSSGFVDNGLVTLALVDGAVVAVVTVVAVVGAVDVVSF